MTNNPRPLKPTHSMHKRKTQHYNAEQLELLHAAKEKRQPLAEFIRDAALKEARRLKAGVI